MAPPANERDRAPIRSMDDLLAPLREACKPASQFRIGAEAEKIGVLERSLTPVSYDGACGVVSVMKELVRAHGWAIADGAGPLLTLEKNGASVTLEPGAQLELSGAPFEDLHAVAAEISAHAAELSDVGDTLAPVFGEKIAWLGVGFHPFARQADLSWVPKPRYGIMRRYLPARGRYGLDMMRRTATVQANFDYEDEDHAMAALRVSMRLSPMFTALVANSPFYEGSPFGGVSYRAKVWLSVDPARQGLVEAVLSPKSRFVDYVEWALDAPMFVVLRDEQVIENTGQSFRSFMKHGFGPHRATYGDWVTHLNTLFPEVRLKRTLEIRGGDSLPSGLVVGPAALFTGLLYDRDALAKADELTESYGIEELEALRGRVPFEGPRALFRGRPCGEVMQTALELAAKGLANRARRQGGADERLFLQPLVELAARLRCPADALLDAYREAGQGPPAVPGGVGGGAVGSEQVAQAEDRDRVALASLGICRI